MKHVDFRSSDYRNNIPPSWCSGCSFFGIMNSLTDVFSEHHLNPSEINVISGIGCSSRMPLHLATFGMHTLHGRALPVAIGARIARPDIPVVVAAGDGDLFSIGTGHFVHAASKNIDLTVICMDNQIYAMTKNQASPTSPTGYCGTLTPYGKLSVPLNVVEFAIASEATFVSRTSAFDTEHMKKMFSRALEHKGFSLVEVLAPCRTYGKEMMVLPFSEMIIDINEELSHDPADRIEALAKASASSLDYNAGNEVKIPVGIFLEKKAPSFEEKILKIDKKSSCDSQAFVKKYLLSKLV